ncbi:MAG TPA: hypothetical protein PLL26_03760 [Candidatus Dojkabacteria bacterium]|nr:hypothetical protein [Candidatus Dojkabacteria bacterium]
MLKQLKPDHLYMIIDIKEPYIEKIFEILKAGQIEKGDWPEGDIDFKTWVEQTFGREGLEYIKSDN